MVKYAYGRFLAGVEEKMKRLLALLMCMFLFIGHAGAERLPDDQLITYYDQAVFVGDSISELFRFYVNGVVRKEHPDYFNGVKFYAAHGYKLATAAAPRPSHTETNISYKGNAVSVRGLMERTQPGKVFILLGLGDRIGDDIDKGMEYVEAIVSTVAEVSPDTKVHFFSLTPIDANVEKKAPNRQSKWDAYNVALEAKCKELGAYYIEIAAPLKDEKGLLAQSLATEDGYHLNNDGNAIWVQMLLEFAQGQYDAGLWAPAEKE